MSEYSNQYFHTPFELDFPSVEYQGNGSFEEYIAELIQSRHIVGANGSALIDNECAKAMELFDDAVETAFFTAMYPRGRGNEIPFYIAPAIVSQAKDMDGNFVFSCDRYAICSRSEMSFGEIREAFRMIDADEVVSYIADCFEDNLLEFLKQSAPTMPTHASSAASAAVSPAEVSEPIIEEAEVVSVETVQPIADEPTKPTSSSRRSKSNRDFSMTPEFLYLHFADALGIENIQSAKENTFYVEGNSVVLNSLEYDDEEGVQRTIVKYDLGGKKKTLYTTVASKDGTIVRYDWRSCAKYAWALEQGVDDDGNFPADTLSQAMTRDACDKPSWKSKGVTFVPTPPAEAAAAKGNSPKIKNAYGETQGELWKVLNEDEDGQQWDSFYYICDPSAQRSTVIDIEHGSVSDRQLCLLDGTDEEGRKGLRLLLEEWEAELITDYPLDVMTMLMVLGVAPKPEAVTWPKPVVEEVAVEEIIVTANAEPETAEANVEPINTEEVETPVVTPEVVDDDPIAAMQRLAEELRKKQEAEMAAMMQQIQQAQEEKRRKEEEARRKAEEEAKRKAAEEEARRKAEAEEAERKKREAEEARRKAEEEAKRKAAEEEARRKAEEEASAAATSAVVQTQPSDDDEEIRCEQFDEILMWVKKGIPVVLWGPAGTGKDITCMQIAKALGVPYHSINAVLDTFEAFGHTDGHGVFHDTELTRAWTDGGLCGCTELFASDPQVLNTLNEALSNGYMIINGKRVKKHPQCYIMASDNTVGTGGNSTYTGRQRIDEATLNRFMLIEVGYDHRVEMKVAKGNAAAVEFAEDFRNACAECGGLDIVRSLRQTHMFVEGLDADGLSSVKWTPAAPYIKTAEEQCIHRCFHRYMSDDDFVLIASKLRCVRNAYTRAMRSMAEAIKTA